MAAAKEGSSSDRIEEEGSSSDRIEERVLAHKWLASIACAVVAVLVLLPVYAERVAEPADANAGTGCWVVAAYTVNAARPGGGVYREWFQGWHVSPHWRSDDAMMTPPCCQKDPNRTSLVIPYHESYADKGWWGDGYGPHNATLHHVWFCEEDDACASCPAVNSRVEAATCAAGAANRGVAPRTAVALATARTRTRKGLAGGPATPFAAASGAATSWWGSRARRQSSLGLRRTICLRASTRCICSRSPPRRLV